MRPCISRLPAADGSARLAAAGSPLGPGVIEPVSEHGAPAAAFSENPNGRLGRRRAASPHSQGRAMEKATPAPVFVGIDVAKDRLDMHVLPSGEALAFPNDDAGASQIAALLVGLPAALVVLERSEERRVGKECRS